MSKVEFIEVVTEVGESYVIDSNLCSISLDGIYTCKEVWEGEVVSHNTSEYTRIKIDKFYNIESMFESLVEDRNILKVILHCANKENEEYYVNWCDGDVDENSYQKSTINKHTGDLVITINENNN